MCYYRKVINSRVSPLNSVIDYSSMTTHHQGFDWAMFCESARLCEDDIYFHRNDMIL